VVEWSIAPVLKTGGPQGPVGSNPTPSAILSVATDCAPLFVFIGYFGVLVFWCFAWLTILYCQKVGNPLETGRFSVADWWD